MSVTVSTVLWATGTLTVLGVTISTYLSLAMEPSPLRRILGSHSRRLEQHTRFIRSSLHGADIAGIQCIFVLAAVFALLIFPSVPLFLLGAALATLPGWSLARLHRRRVARLEEQLDSWLLLLANALSASPSIGEAIASTAGLVPAPFREELDVLVKESRLGTPVDEAARNMARRIQSPSISAALSTIVLARQTGGSLPQILEHTASTLRESARLEGVVRTKTAEGRGQVIALAGMPFVLCAVIAWLDPAWFDPMRNRPAGQLVLLLCGLVWAVALVWARRIVELES